jgi:hypothetical protein
LLEYLADQATQAANEAGEGGEVGPLSPLRAMMLTCSRHTRSMPGLEITPREAANNTTSSSVAGGKANAPVSSFFKAGIEGAEVDLVVEQRVQRVLESAGQ